MSNDLASNLSRDDAKDLAQLIRRVNVELLNKTLLWDVTPEWRDVKGLGSTAMEGYTVYCMRGTGLDGNATWVARFAPREELHCIKHVEVAFTSEPSGAQIIRGLLDIIASWKESNISEPAST